MATVAGPGTLPPESLRPGGNRLRRKTPSELRGEQLMRGTVSELVDASLLGSVTNNCAMDGIVKPETLKPPRTRVDEVYPAKKSRFKMIPAKEFAKENLSVDQTNIVRTALSSVAAPRKVLLTGRETYAVPSNISHNIGSQTRRSVEACSLSTFRSVAEISSSGDKLPNTTEIDMGKVLKGLAAHERSTVLAVDSSETTRGPSAAGNICHEGITIAGKIPLDLTLKTAIRVVSSSPLNRIRRSIIQGGFDPTPKSSSSEAQAPHSSSGIASVELHSWIYPQSTLPPSLMSILISSAAEKVEMDFLKKRELGWEEAFRSLYYMLRKRACHLFYACTSQFVVMFTGNNKLGMTKDAFNAYISRSTRGMRSLLREHDVSFSMPLCLSNVEQVASEDLVELSEIEKHNLGQARRPSSLANIDSSPQSLLAICGKKNVHGLYDVLLNYRSSLTILTGEDVPVLYSPVPFQNAALSMPEVRCIEMKQTDDGPKEGIDSGPLGNSLEIRDAYLPPWVVCNLCRLVGSLGSFEASFMTDGVTAGLNAALGVIDTQLNSEAMIDSFPLRISEAAVSPLLRSGFLKSLKFCDGSYSASIVPA